MAEVRPVDTGDRLAHAKATWDNRPLHRYFGITLEAIGDGYARFSLEAGDRNRGGVHGAAHGGILAFLADVAALAAVSTVMGERERAAGTAELNISYLSPAIGSVVTEARVLRKGRSLVVSDVDLCDRQGKLLAKSRVSYALRPVDIAGRPGSPSASETPAKRDEES